MAGRPSSYTTEIGTEICRRLAEGESLRQICRDEIMPDRQTVVRWLVSQDKSFDPFRGQYAQARAAQAELMAEEILEISDDGSNDWMERETQNGPVTVVDHEHISRSKLRVDSRKWLMSKILPKKFGEKITQEHTGPNGGPIQSEDVSLLTPTERQQRLAALLAGKPEA